MKLKILSLNTWILPQPITWENKKRVERIISLINRLKPDIICLQEVWINYYVNYFRSKLIHYHPIHRKSKIYNKTGLLTFSINKPLKSQIRSFNRLGGDALYDRFAYKGYIESEHLLKNVRFRIINTQLNCPINTRHQHSWKSQLSEILRFTKSQQIPTIIAGDFNNTLIPALTKSFKEQSCDATYSVKNPYLRKGFHIIEGFLFKDLTNTDLKIDHILIFPQNLIKNIKTTTIKNALVSDHYPLFSEVEL